LTKKNLWLGILAMVLVLTMTVTGCDFFKDLLNNIEDNGNDSGSGGILKLTDIPSQYNGKYAIYLESRSTPSAIGLYGCQSINVSTGITITAVQISNGSVSLPMWVQGSGGTTRYSGNHTIGDSRNSVAILNTATFSPGEIGLAYKYFQSITFSNGSATISWNNADGNGGGGQNDPGDLAGTWKGNIGVYNAIITISGSGWTMTASNYPTFLDSGYFVRNGTTLTLYLSSGTNNGTATITNSTTIQLNLNNNTIFPGNYTLTKQL